MLSRNPDQYIDSDVKVTGEVGVVTESNESDQIAIVLNIKESSIKGYYEDSPIWIYGKKESIDGHIVEKDIITVWGVFDGMQVRKEYTQDKEYPGISIKYIEFNNPVAPAIDEPVEYSDNVSEQDFKNSCINVDSVNLERYPNRFFNKNIKVTGEVYYVKENIDGDIDEIQILTSKDDYGYNIMGGTAIIRGIILDNNRILKDDILTVWGVGSGLKYKTNYSAEPVVEMKYYQFEK